MARKPKRRWRRIFIPVGLLAVAWVVGLFIFVDRIPEVAGDQDGDLHTDAIVVLTGGRGRVELGTALLARSAAQKMLISGVAPNVAPRDVIPATRLESAILECCVTLGRAARNTRENAVETAGWDGDALEAQAFAHLAVRSLRGLPISLPTTTGVREPTAGGTIHWPPD